MKRSPYPNIFILPKKYNSVADVRVKDVVDAFPLYEADTLHKFDQIWRKFATFSQKLKSWAFLRVHLQISKKYCPTFKKRSEQIGLHFIPTSCHTVS